MAIQDILNKLLNEPFMMNMRQHMVDGLNQVYKDAIFKGDTNMEVVRSRNTYPALYDRLDAFDEKQIDTINTLSQKASINYVDALLLDIAKGGPKGYFTSIAAFKNKYPDATGAEGTWLVFDTTFGTGAHAFIWDSVGKIWKDLGLYQSNGIPDESITEKQISPNSEIVIKETGKNHIDLSDYVNGLYIRYDTGVPSVLEGYGYIEYKPVVGGQTYTLSNQSDGKLSLALEQIAFYTEEARSGYISGLSNSGKTVSVTFVAPTNAKFIRITVREPIKEFYQLEVGSQMTLLESNRKEIPMSDLPKIALDKLNNIESVVTLYVGSGKPYSRIRDALDKAKLANKKNRYVLMLNEEIFDLRSEYTDAEINNTSFIGWNVSDYVGLIGVGDVDKTILELTLDPAIFDGTTRARVSTIAKKGTSKLENITVKNTNGRYAVHDDYEYDDLERNVINCKFFKYGTGYEQSYGGGMWSGSDFKFKKCYFYTDTTGIPFSFHNNINFLKPSNLRIEECKFENKLGSTVIRFGSMGSGQKDVIEMIGNSLSGRIKFFEEQSNGVGIDFELKGYGNDIVPVEVVSSHPTQQVTYDFVGQTIKMTNGDSQIITKGSLVRLNSYGNAILKLSSTHNIIHYYGIAMKDIPIGHTGYVQRKGYLAVSDTGLMLSLGDKVGIVNGLLTKVTTTDFIGFVEMNGYIKLV